MIISPFLVLNSNLVNKKKEEQKIFKQNEIFMRKLYGRNLDFEADTNTICEKGTEDLRNYYKTGDLETIGLKEGPIEGGKGQPDYINNLVDLVSGEGDIMNYIMHLIPALIFLVITILFLPGWLVCCICSCANCCCCCCCKKPQCKLPFFIVTSVIYALGIAISIYGLSVSNSVFVGLADTECSILKFVGEVLDGETREEKPRWGGIREIKNIFEQTKININSLTETKKGELNTNKEESKTSKNDFEIGLETHSQNIINSNDYKQTLTLRDTSKSGDYYLDIAQIFGRFTKTGDGTVQTTQDSFVEKWYTEYKIIAQNSESQMGTAYENFDQLIDQKDNAINALDSGVSSINDIQSSFDSIKDSISQAIIDYSGIIEDYGKQGFKAVFSILLVIDAAIAAFITLRIFTQFLACKNGCLKCFLKSLIHILWNILALLTFFTLLFGSIFILLGTIGKDLISAVTVLISDENLSKNDDSSLLGESGEYLKTCINGDGDLQKTLNLDISAMDNIENLKSASNELESIKNETETLLNQKAAYTWYNGEFNKRKDYETINFDLIKDDNSYKLNLEDYLGKLNNKVSSSDGKWDKFCDSTKEKPCSSPQTSNYCIKFPSCTEEDSTGWYSSGPEDLKVYKNVVFAFIILINKARSEETGTIAKALKELDILYTKFLKTQTSSLKTFIETIEGLTGIFNDFMGEEGGIFSMLNCLFIGRNVKVILKYLEKTLGSNIYTVGVCLLITGIAMCFSIAFTILLNIIINTADVIDSEEGVPELGNNGNDPNVHLDNYPQGNFDTEKVNYGENYNQNYNNNDNFNGGVRVIHYND
jgi:hypothetical protein